jgi:hypothetical protein
MQALSTCVSTTFDTPQPRGLRIRARTGLLIAAILRHSNLRMTPLYTHALDERSRTALLLIASYGSESDCQKTAHRIGSLVSPTWASTSVLPSSENGDKKSEGSRKENPFVRRDLGLGLNSQRNAFSAQVRSVTYKLRSLTRLVGTRRAAAPGDVVELVKAGADVKRGECETAGRGYPSRPII